MRIKLFFNAPSGRLYAGVRADGFCTGRRVKDGKLTGPLRGGIYGDIIARTVSDAIQPERDGSLPRHADIELEDGSRASVGQFLDSRADLDARSGCEQ